MTIEEAIKNLKIMLEWSDPREIDKEAVGMAIKSLEAWEKVKDQLSQQVHLTLDLKENFEIGSTSRTECNTTASVLAGVIYLIDKHLSGVENDG